MRRHNPPISLIRKAWEARWALGDSDFVTIALSLP
jgi:hypothetical protein